MLSRVAGCLFWIGRYVDRAENIARLADAARRIEALPGDTVVRSTEWASALIAAGVREPDGFHGVDRREAVHSLFFDEDNPSSVLNCLTHARENGRTVRPDITQECWEALNAAWRDYRSQTGRPLSKDGLADLIDWIKSMTAQIRGTINGTLLRNDGYYFVKLGQAVERIDSTARLLDVKYHVLLPEVDAVGSPGDRIQWQALLHAASAQRAYTFVTKSDLSAKGVSEFLTLSGEFPRSIRFNAHSVRQTLANLEAYYGRPAQHRDTVIAFTDWVESRDIQSIIDMGLHEFLTEVVERNFDVADAIGVSYGFVSPTEGEGDSPKLSAQIQ